MMAILIAMMDVQLHVKFSLTIYALDSLQFVSTVVPPLTYAETVSSKEPKLVMMEIIIMEMAVQVIALFKWGIIVRVNLLFVFR
jgi:hypothetical protein